MKSALYFVAALYIVTISEVTSDYLSLSSNGTNLDPCASKASCHECIQTVNCAWCTDPNFGDRKRCFQQPISYITNSFDCREEYIWNPDNTIRVIQKLDLSNAHFNSGGNSVSKLVQIAPQHMSFKLRISDPYIFKMFYTRAEDFPVDLYYLVDLSKSMEDDKENLDKLGKRLANTLRNITSDFRIGFGSFFSQVPSENSEPVIEFRNHMTLSTNSTSFLHMVNSAELSKNQNGVKGGLKALMQAVACKSEIGWRENSKKIIVFSTDAGFHTSEDEELGKIVSPDHSLCHLDAKKGYYTHSDVQDYPSISQLNLKVRENQINIIFAVTEQQVPNYRHLSHKIEGSAAGVLSTDSSNVVQLVEELYEQISFSVEMKDNATSGIRLNYYSTCLNYSTGSPKQTNKCKNMKVGDVVQFDVEIEVLACPKDPKDWQQTLQIYPVGINESLIVNLEMLCSCSCENPEHYNYIEKAPQCSGVGVYKCGICECEPDFFGRRCECEAAGLSDTDSCRPNNETEIECSGRGNCVCENCACESRENPNELIYGKHCECDNFSCDRHNGEICSGHGKCECGSCLCVSPWTGPACNCYQNNDTCYPPHLANVEICFGHGQCVCGQCECDNTEDATYSGKFCERKK